MTHGVGLIPPASKALKVVGVLAIAGLVAALLFETRLEESPPPAEREGYQNERARQFRRLLGNLSRRTPPAMVRPKVGGPIALAEFEAPFVGYVVAVCARFDEKVARGRGVERSLEIAWTDTAASKERLFGHFSVNGVSRTVTLEVQAFLEDKAREFATSPCGMLALVEVLRDFPEAEPGSLLGDVVRSKHGGSSFTQAMAVECMGETGRADYAALLAELVEPDLPAAVAWRAAAASARIRGDASLALRIVEGSYPWSEDLAVAFHFGVVPATGPTAIEVVEKLVDSDDPLRRTAGFRAATFGVGLPDALPSILHAARTPDLSEREVDSALAAIGESSSADDALLALAQDSTASPMIRAKALARMPDELAGRIDLAEEIARLDLPAGVAFGLARSAMEEDNGIAERILTSYAADPAHAGALMGLSNDLAHEPSLEPLRILIGHVVSSVRPSH